jgi:prepilin-type N-terminal cleavage/methylation domain-containing protein
LRSTCNLQPSTFNLRRGFTLIEVMVVVVLLSFIVLALMAVFNSTQKAFRASVTQTDVLEGGRATMDFMAADLRAMAPSFGQSNGINGAVNFCVTNYSSNMSLNQPMVGLIDPNTQRTNIQENFFVLSRNNLNGHDSWIGTGYAVYVSPSNLYSLYRFSTNYPVMASGGLSNLFYADFRNFLLSPNNYSHLMDGVVDLRVKAFDADGVWINTNRQNVITNSIIFSGSQFIPNEVGCIFYSNALPSSVEIEMGVLEDRTLQRAESLPNNLPSPSPNDRRTLFLQSQAGQVHIFRERVSIQNVDPAAYQ